MRSTRRLLDRRSRAVLAALATCSSAVLTFASCSSEVTVPVLTSDDSGVDSAPADDAAPPDAASDRDADADTTPFDGGSLPISCATTPCATSLVTSQRQQSPSEGFCALLSDRTVACWGSNTWGELGRGDDAGPSSPSAARVSGLGDVAELEHTCALDKSGSIWCWGTAPVLRDDAGASTREYVPVKLPLPAATSMSIAEETGCAVIGGGVQCWGSNRHGQIAPLDVASVFSTLPVTDISIPQGAPIRKVIVGDATFALRTDGTVLSWGDSPPLARVSSLFPDPYPKPIPLSGISSLDILHSNACATSAGIGHCWGVTDSSTASLDRAMPEPVVAPEPLLQIAMSGTARWCAVGASGAVYCRGENANGQAGDGTKDHAYHAVKVEGLPAPAAEVRTTPLATCALLTSGQVYCWGANTYGQLGNGKPKVPSVIPQEVVLP